MAKRPTHAEQLAAIKRPHERMAMHTANARLLLGLRNLYTEHAALLATGGARAGPAYGQAATLLRELEPESEPDDADAT